MIMSRIPRRGRMLILSFGVEQGNETSHGEEVVSASVQSLVRRLHKFQPYDFDVLVVDECFPAGTLIDGVPIEQIQEGNYVTAYNHKTKCLERHKVLHTFKRPAPNKMVRINGEIICTQNHPVYENRTGRYINAANLKLGDSILCRVRSPHEMGFINASSTLQISQNRQSLLFGDMQKQLLSKSLIRDNEQDEQEICFSSHEVAQSNEEYGISSKDVSDTSSNGTQAQNTGRERSRIDRAAGFIDEAPRLLEAAERICGKDSRMEDECRTLSYSLQDRHSDTCRNDSDRSGWYEPYIHSEESTGCEEGGFLEVQRVDSIEILELRDTFF